MAYKIILSILLQMKSIEVTALVTLVAALAALYLGWKMQSATDPLTKDTNKKHAMWAAVVAVGSGALYYHLKSKSAPQKLSQFIVPLDM